MATTFSNFQEGFLLLHRICTFHKKKLFKYGSNPGNKILLCLKKMEMRLWIVTSTCSAITILVNHKLNIQKSKNSFFIKTVSDLYDRQCITLQTDTSRSTANFNT